MAKVTVTITEYMSELIYDIQNKTYLTGRSRQDGTNHEAVANMMANDDDENSSQIIRSIGSAFNTLKTKLSEYLSEEGTTANNELLDAATDLSLALNMPCNYNKSTKDAIAMAVHQYLVNMAVAEWFNITNKPDAVDYLNMAATNIQEIREAMSKRVRPTRTDPTPELP